MKPTGKMLRLFFGTAALLLCLFPVISKARDLTGPAQQLLYDAQQALRGKECAWARKIVGEYLQKEKGNIHPLAYEILGSAWYAEGNLQEADRAFRSGWKLAPQSFELCSNLATVAYDRNDFQQAATLFEKAYRLSSQSDGELLYRAGAAFAKAGQMEDAHRVLRELAARKEAMQQPWLQLLIQTDLEIEAWQEADRDLTEYLQRFSTEAVYWKLLSQVQAKQKRFSAAAASLEIAHTLEPPAAPGWKDLADLYSASGVPQQAVRSLLRAYGPEPTPAQCDELARACALAYQFDRAVWLLNSAISKEPTAPRYLELGKLQYDAGLWQDAVDSLRAGLDLQPEDGLAQLLIGYSSIELGRLEDARRAFSQAATDPAYRDRAEQSLRALRF